MTIKTILTITLVVLSTQAFSESVQRESVSCHKTIDDIIVGEDGDLRPPESSFDPQADELCIGVMYANGIKTERDSHKAIIWYKKSFARGYAPAAYNIGYLYHFGKGIPLDYQKAIYWYKKAAKYDFASALMNLASLAYHGQGSEENSEQAFKYWNRAANLNHTKAQASLGWAYMNGYGTEKDKKKAVLWLVKSASRGDEFAIETLKENGLDRFGNPIK